jgi:uncharacterized protein YkwD
VWPDAGPEVDGIRSESTARQVVRRLGPVGIAAIVAAVLVLFGVGAFVLPLALSASGDPGGAAAAPRGTGPGGAGVELLPTDSAGPATPTPVPSATTPGPTAPGNPQFENQVVALVNAERQKAHCQPVRSDDRLRAAARAHSVDMATKNFVSHTGSDGSSPLDRMSRAGYSQGLSENVARGQQRPEDVMRSWTRDRQDRANIVNCAATAIGVGLAYRGRTPYWTQNFGRA